MLPSFDPPSSNERECLIIGDIHGCLEPLEELLREANFRPDRHRLYCVGDTINRGPHNLGVLQLLRRLGALSVRGNHEGGLLLALQSPHPPMWFDRHSFCPDLLNAHDLSSWIDWLESWPLWMDLGDFRLVHAGFHPILPPKETPPRFLTNVRYCDPKGHHPPPSLPQESLALEGYAPWHHFYHDTTPVFYGHWAKQGFHSNNRTLCLDGGCVYGRSLIGLWLPSQEIIRVPGLTR
jgi:bis(5'-nucleosyl)-tetraphosphatase (symmetrical)